MSLVNNYIPPPPNRVLLSPEEALDPNRPYDVNCFFPITDLASDRLKLTPFIPAVHARLFFDGSKDHPELYRYLPLGPFTSVEDMLAMFEKRLRSQPGAMLWLIIDTTKPEPGGIPEGTPNLGGAPAGIVGILNSSLIDECTEIGFVIVLPPFQRTHVTTHAIGLLLRWGFETLKLRRVQWQANHLNAASVRAAERLGFILEGIVRWQRVIPVGKEGIQGRQGLPGRHSALLSVCWDEWESTVKDKIQVLMDRGRVE